VSRDGTLIAKRIHVQPFDPSAVDLAVYPGRYWSEELGTVYDLIITGGRLSARHLRNGLIPLTAYHGETFSSSEYDFGRVVISAMPAGDQADFCFPGVLAKDVRFVRLSGLAP